MEIFILFVVFLPLAAETCEKIKRCCGYTRIGGIDIDFLETQKGDKIMRVAPFITGVAAGIAAGAIASAVASNTMSNPKTKRAVKKGVRRAENFAHDAASSITNMMG